MVKLLLELQVACWDRAVIELLLLDSFSLKSFPIATANTRRLSPPRFTPHTSSTFPTYLLLIHPLPIHPPTNLCHRHRNAPPTSSSSSAAPS